MAKGAHAKARRREGTVKDEKQGTGTDAASGTDSRRPPSILFAFFFCAFAALREAIISPQRLGGVALVAS